MLRIIFHAGLLISLASPVLAKSDGYANKRAETFGLGRSLAVSRSWAVFLLLLSGLVIYSSSGSADTHGFSEGFTHSARIVCDFRQGLMLRLANYRTLDPDANFLGMRNFFVAMRIYGKVHACADALDNYGPQGVIQKDLLDK